MMSLSNGTDSPGAPEARGGRRISFWPMLLGPAAVAAVAVAGRYYSGFEQLDDRLDKLGPYLIGSAAGIYWVRAIVTRNPLYLILTALAASLLCREIHFDGMDRAIFVLLGMCGLWALTWRDAIREPLRRDRRHTSWLIAAFATYFLSQLIAKRVFKFVPGERAAHSKLEEGVETMAHLVFVVAGLVASWRSYRGINRDRPKSGDTN